MKEEITLEDYLQNSGTKTSEPIEAYKTKSVEVRKYKLAPREGYFEKIEIREPKILIF
jgi:hypothetical protein